MKVYIGPYRSWVGPYQIAEKILFWKDKYAINEANPLDTHPDSDAIHRFGEWLATNRRGEDSWLTKLCQWIDSKKKRKIEIRIDGYDVWSMDNTLAMIIVPMLKKLKEHKHGAPNVDDDDVPEHLRSTAAPELTEDQKNTGHTDDNWFKRWDWVLDEMIWTFEQHCSDDWKEQYYSGEADFQFEKIEGTNFSEMKEGPKHTFTVDDEGMKKHSERMTNGRRLFAKYYECLWD